MRMPPMGAAFALEERGAGSLVACISSAGVAWFCGVVGVEFRVADVIEDVERMGAESSSTLLLDF